MVRHGTEDAGALSMKGKSEPVPGVAQQKAAVQQKDHCVGKDTMANDCVWAQRSRLALRGWLVITGVVAIINAIVAYNDEDYYKRFFPEVDGVRTSAETRTCEGG